MAPQRGVLFLIKLRNAQPKTPSTSQADMIAVI
jgi:hypothetical protein